MLKKITVIIFVLILAFSIEAKRLKVLIHMTEKQGAYFTDTLMEKFEEETGHKVEVLKAPSIDEIPWLLKMNVDKLSLVKVPFIHAWSLVDSGYIKPLDRFRPSDDVEQFKKEYMLTYFGRKNIEQYLLPRKFETRIMVHRADKMNLLREQLNYYKDSINIVLKSMNGYGLPANFVLENDPNLWNDFDIFVLGWIWSRLEFNGITKPRIAFRAGNYSGTSQRVIDRVIQIGGDSLQIMTINGPAVTDAFHWEAAFAYSGIYTPKMLSKRWKGKNIWEGFKNDDVFLSYMTQVDCFELLGNPKDTTDGYFFGDPDSLIISLMPSGASLALTKQGFRERIGTHSITTGGWWWAIPMEAPDPDLSYDLYRFITDQKNQKKECLKFGMIPVRNDLVQDKSILFDKGKLSEILRISYQQLQKNGNNILFSDENFNRISELYLKAWEDIVIKRKWNTSENEPPSRDYIESLLRRKYYPKAKKILGIKETSDISDTTEGSQ